MITFGLDLNLIPGKVLPRLNVSQYNKGQTVECIIYHGGQVYSVPSGATALINGTKPDKTGFEYNATVSGGEVVFTITEQMTAVAGDVTCEVVILKDGERVGTINFLLVVEAAALRSDVPISETDIPVIEQIPEMVAEATKQAQIAEAWATGGEGGEASATNNAKYWAEQSQSYAVGALHWKGNTTFANIPTTGITTGDVYNVTDAFTTDSRFNEGSGIACEAGTNIIYGNNGKWDVQAPPSVHSFNGRKGAVVPASGDYTDELVTSSAITGKATVKAALQGLNSDKQPKTMSQTIAGQTTVEGCLSQLNTHLTWKYAGKIEGSTSTGVTVPNTAVEVYVLAETPFYKFPKTFKAGTFFNNHAEIGGYFGGGITTTHSVAFRYIEQGGAGVVYLDLAVQDGNVNTPNAVLTVWYR